MNHSGYSSTYARSSHKSLQYKAAGGTCNHVRVEEVSRRSAGRTPCTSNPSETLHWVADTTGGSSWSLGTCQWHILSIHSVHAKTMSGGHGSLCSTLPPGKANSSFIVFLLKKTKKMNEQCIVAFHCLRRHSHPLVTSVQV